MDIPIIIISSILGLYAFIIFIIVIQLLKTNSKLKRRNHGINVILAQKYHILVILGNYMEEKNAKLPSKIKEALSMNDFGDIKNKSTQEVLSIKNVLMNTLNTLFYIGEQNGLNEDPKYVTLKNSLKDVDANHRKEIALFNADATAYNYWVNSLLFKPFKFLFKLKDKEVLY